MANIKTAEEIAKLRVSGQMTAKVLQMIEPYVVPGVSTEKLNQLCHDYITTELQAVPSSLHYHGYPKSICTSVNHVVCHGIPSDKKILKNGDIINIDVTVLFDDYQGDSSAMFCVGKVPTIAKRVVDVTQQCLYKAIQIVKPGTTLGDIGATIEQHANNAGFSVVRDYCGHGIGKKLHESPNVLHYGTFGQGEVLEEGMVFTIEPMINVGKEDTLCLKDNWTVITKDRELSAQWEHTIVVTKDGFDILTLRENEPWPQMPG